MKDTSAESQPAGVEQETKQAGNARDRCRWAEPTVWTARMLAALEVGVKGGKWFSLIDKVHKPRHLKRAFEKTKEKKGAAGVDHETIEEYEAKLDANLAELGKQLREGRYRPQKIRRVWIPKEGSNEKRPLGIPTVRDRVAQNAVRDVLEPIFERDFAQHSYGFRPGRGCKTALRRVSKLLKKGYEWVVDADLKKYFDTIPHDRLMGEVEKKVSDGRMLELVKTFLTQEVMETGREWQPEEGTPQGAVLSPLLANIYLDPVDHLMEQKGYEMVRYADDFVVLCRSEKQAREALKEIEVWVSAAGLTLHPEKTRIVDSAQKGGFDFLGYHFERSYRWPSGKSLKKFKDKIRSKTKRANGHSMDRIVSEVNRTLKGWFEYFKHSIKYTFPPLDSWVRMRLRSILRKRKHGRGCGRGRDHQRWPNTYFAGLGLFSMTTARELVCQSSRR